MSPAKVLRDSSATPRCSMFVEKKNIYIYIYIYVYNRYIYIYIWLYVYISPSDILLNEYFMSSFKKLQFSHLLVHSHLWSIPIGCSYSSCMWQARLEFVGGLPYGENLFGAAQKGQMKWDRNVRNDEMCVSAGVFLEVDLDSRLLQLQWILMESFPIATQTRPWKNHIMKIQNGSALIRFA